MNKEIIIRMAREAKLIMETDCTTPWMENHDLTPYLERFAALVAAHEREACAKVCEQPVDEIQITDDCSEYKYRDNQECADAIRAKSKHEWYEKLLWDERDGIDPSTDYPETYDQGGTA